MSDHMIHMVGPGAAWGIHRVPGITAWLAHWDCRKSTADMEQFLRRDGLRTPSVQMRPWKSLGKEEKRRQELFQ